MADDNTLNELLASASVAQSTTETVSIRQFITDFSAGRYNFNLPFQRKPQWKQSEKSAWVRAMLKDILVDSLSISKRGREKRGINGGNRARTTVEYAENRFPMELISNGKTYNYWFNDIPLQYRQNRFHKTLSSDARERYLDKNLALNVRLNLTDQEEVEWYENMNKNQKSHTKGQLLISQLCRDVEDPFVNVTLDMFPVLKTRIQIPHTPNDNNSVGTYLAEIFNIHPAPMDERDSREDFAMVLANFTNLLSNGKPYNSGFKGTCSQDVVAQNVETLRRIFQGLTFSDAMLAEFHEPSSSRKQFLPRIWSPSYLLGPICWSIGNQKENVVDVWRVFLQRCIPNTISSTYLNETNDESYGDESVAKYKTAWDNVALHVGR
jgi:hypothetical protein